MLTLDEQKRLDKIKEEFDFNGQVISQCAMYLNHTPDALNEQLINEITGGEKSLERGAVATFLSSVFCEDEKDARFFFSEYYSKMVKNLDKEEYEKNPYYKNIKIPKSEMEGWTLGSQKYKPYELFIWDDLQIDGYRERPQLGYFDSEFEFPTVFEKGIEWMAIKPNEIETMKEPIEKARGNVLVLGLGLGYYTYMISNKKEVSSITVVERDKSVIALFERYILPQFENKEKITVVNMDAFEYLDNHMKNESFDFSFADLWHDISDGTELYLRLRKKEYLSSKTEYSYWIERSILSGVRANIFHAVYENIKNGKLEKSIDEIEKMISYDSIKELTRYI